MKKALLSLAVLFLSLQANAGSILPSILEFREVPAAFDVAQPLKKLTIFANGKVVAQKGLTLISVKTISHTQVSEIYRAIEEVKQGKLVKQPRQMFCFVASPVEFSYTTGMLEDVLYSGHPCNGNEYKTNTQAGNALIELLNDLKQEAFSKD